MSRLIHHTLHSPLTPQSASPQMAETVVSLLGLHWSLNTLVQGAAALVGIVALVFIAYQAFLSRRAREVAALHMRYSMILENNKFIFNNPEFVPLSMGAKRYHLVKALDLEERKRLAAYELLLDNFEFYFLVGFYEDRKHATTFARKLLQNPGLQEFLASEYSGTFRRQFARIIEEVLATYPRNNNFKP